jgi:adenylate cyclase
VFRGPDPLLGKDNWYGSAVARAARIEPITPPGEIYVTEPFAAILALETGLDAYSCEYDGEVPIAKGYGHFRMYRLCRGTTVKVTDGAEVGRMSLSCTDAGQSRQADE